MVLRSVLLRAQGSVFRLSGPKQLANNSLCRSFRNERSYSLLTQRPARCGIPNFWTPLVLSRGLAKAASEASASTLQTAVNEETASDAVSTASAAIANTTNSSIPADAAGSDVISDAVNNIMANIPPALQYGDLAALGLAGWTPAGLVRWSMELINVATGLPWFWTIVAGSVFWRVIVMPLTISSLQTSARLQPLQPKIKAAMDEMQRIRESGDRLALQRHALKIQAMYKESGVDPRVSLLTPLVQIPVTLGVFFGVKRLCEHPVPQLKQSGMEWLSDLTVPDPTMLLPVALCAAVNLQISVGSSELNLQTRPEMGHLMNALRIFSVLGIWVMNAFPSGLLISLLTTTATTTLQSLALQYPPIRTALKIPVVPKESRTKLPSMLESARFLIDSFKRKYDEAQTTAAAQPKRKRLR